MAIDLDDFVLEVVARVHAPDMGAKRAFEALRVVVVVQEIVAAMRVGFGIVLLNFVAISYFLTKSHNF